jgi:hypothetical protein
MEKTFHFIKTMILEDTNPIMYLENTQTFLEDTGMMKILAWAGIQRMMTRQVKKYGYGDYHSRE